jgi:nucleoside-diphosphate-sugar epimerase
LVSEKYCEEYYWNYGIRTTCLRQFKVFGSNQNLKSEYSAVIPKFIDCIINNKPIVVYGNGLQSRDFVHVDDIVNLIQTILNNDKEPDSIRYNVSGGVSITVLDVLSELGGLLNKKVSFDFSPIRDGDIVYSKANLDRIKKELNWQPQVSFSEGLKKTVEWYKNKI